jgi:hypothetical protein
VKSPVELKPLLKRAALLAAANWPVVAVQFAAETTFQVLLAVPIVGAAILVAVLLGADLAAMLRGNLREIFTTIAGTLMAEPLALVAFIASFAVALVGASALTFVVKGGTVAVMLAANADASDIEHEPLTFELFRGSSRFSIARFLDGCARLTKPYVSLGLVLMVTYAVSVGGYAAFVVYGYRMLAGRLLLLGWTFIAALAAVALIVWITFVNVLYLLHQIAIAVEGVGVCEAARVVARFIRAEFRDLVRVFGVVFLLVAAATAASALAWSGVGLIAFVPLVGLAVFPLQIAAFLMRGLAFEYLGLTALGAYITLYARHAARRRERTRSLLQAAESTASAQA